MNIELGGLNFEGEFKSFQITSTNVPIETLKTYTEGGIFDGNLCLDCSLVDSNDHELCVTGLCSTDPICN